MTTEQQAVTIWMLLAGQDCPVKPKLATMDVANLRVRLIEEEAGELSAAIEDGNLVEIADAIGDLLYVVLGAAAAYGLDLEPIFREIHRSNMSKFTDGHKRADGKWQKGPGYSPAKLEPIIQQQLLR